MMQKRVPAQKKTVQLNTLWKMSLDDHVIDLAWSPSGNYVAAAAIGGPISICHARTGEVRHVLAGHGFGTTKLDWSPNEVALASAGQDGKIKLWTVANGELQTVLSAGSAWAEHVTWSHDGKFLASAAGKKLKIWNAEGQLQREYADATSTIADIAWKPRENILAVCSYGRTNLWSPNSDAPIRTFDWKGSSLKLAWSGDSRFLATGDQDSTVHFWYTATGKDLQMWGYESKVRELAWDRTSRYLATGGSATVVIWDCAGKGPEGTKPRMLSGHDGPLTWLEYQRKGDALLSGGMEGNVFVWKPTSERKPIASLDVNSEITKARWSPDDSLMVVGTDSGRVTVCSM